MGLKSKVLIIGATGNLGFHLAQFSLKFSHPTFLLVRDTAFSDTLKAQKLQSLSNSGAIILKGSLDDERSLVEAVNQVDVIICSVPSRQVLDQRLLIKVIKNAGCIKRFIPSEFGADPDKVQIPDMADNFYTRKAEIRRLVEAEGIPYTYISCNFFMRLLLPSLAQQGFKTLPRDKVTIYGDGNVKAVFVKEQDAAAFTIRTLDDPCTLNKVLYLRPPGNVCSMNELVDIWESKIGKKLQRLYVSESELLTKMKDDVMMAFMHSAFVKGDHTYFDIESCRGVEGTQLYPDLKYTTISEHLETLL